MGDDSTKECLRDMQAKFPQFSLQDLRTVFCSECRNFGCKHAKLAGNPWEQRMATQVDRLLENPLFANLQDPRWSHLRELDFPSLFQESIRLHLAEQRGDWSLPSQREVDAAMGVIPDQSATEPNPEVERAVKALKRLHTVIQINSQTHPGVVYEVTLDDEGKAVSCTCLAGRHKRRCTHRLWAEKEYQRRQRDSEENTSEKTSEEPQNALAEKGGESPLPILGVRQGPPEGRQGPIQGLARNTALPNQGMLLEGAPADGLRKITRDPWAPVLERSSVVPSGVQITIGKKKDE